MLKDLRHAIRVLSQAKGWTAVVVISLALGIGANTAMFSNINGLLIKTVPVKNPGNLVKLRYAGRNDMVTSSSDYGFSGKDASGRDIRTTFSYPMFQQFLVDNRTMDDLFACAPYGTVNVAVNGQADIANAFISTGNYYQALGVSARPGRTILPSDDRPGAPPVAVVSSKYWQSRFAGAADIVGKVIRVNNVPVTIVGVIEPVFTGIQRAITNPPDIAVPLALDSQLSPDSGDGGKPRLSQGTYWWLQVMGRLKPGATVEQVQGNLEGVFQQTARAGLDQYFAGLSETERATSSNRNRTQMPHLIASSGSRGVYEVNTNELRSVTILTVVVALVLLIVCANVANLLLSRATTRQKEISVRLSLGATRGRLIRMLLTESLVLAFIGGALGIAVGYWGKQLLPGTSGQLAPIDWRVLTFVLAVTTLTGVIFGIAPALRSTSLNVSSALKESGRSVIGSRSILSKALLVVQVALSLMLLIGAGLFLRTLQNLRNVNVGFNPLNLAIFRVNPTLNGYDEKRIPQLYIDMMQRLGSVPGVRSVALSNPIMLSGSVNSTSIFVQGRVYGPDQHDSINRVVISPNFFAAMEIPLLTGRAFNDRDTETAPKVVVINDAAARKYFPNENPIGHRFGQSVETSGQLEIVGVLRDTKYDSVRDPAPPTMYQSYAQTRVRGASFAVRTANDPVTQMASIREAMRQIDPNLPLTNVTTQVEQIETRFVQERVFAQAYSLFGGLAVLLASIGLFGLMSYSVARRTNEIGIRMALGARGGDVLRLVMRESMILVVAGVVIGLAAAFAAGQLVATLLFGLSPTDALTIGAATVLMLIVSAVAGYLPARRASRVDPMVALRCE
jgi:predicted permease